jgi:uncharacterized circularly permuted ATP-grasp superfamily protein
MFPPTCFERKDDLAYVLDHLAELVVKEAQGSGGYGMLIGPTASEREREGLPAAHFGRARRNSSPSRRCRCLPVPTFVESGVAPRHIDLRPFVLSGKDVVMVPGGLTRVALKEGSLVVNSSQGVDERYMDRR